MPKICLGEDGFVRIGDPRPPIRRDEVLSFAQKEGFQGIELHAQFEMYTPGVARATKEYYAKYGQEIPGLQTGHISFFYPPISEDDTTRENYVNAVEDALKFDRELGANHSTLTPPHFTEDMTKEYDKLLDRYIKVITEVVARAEKYDVVMAIEPEPNLIMNGGGLRDSLEDVKHVLNTIRSNNLAILYDIAHVNIVSHGDPVGFLKALNGRVSWVHVADNDFSLTAIGTGKHQKFGEGNVDMVKLFQTMKQECPNLRWLQIDTWENPFPFEAAAMNRNELARILKEINWI